MKYIATLFSIFLLISAGALGSQAVAAEANKNGEAENWGVNPQLQGHFNVGINVGLSQAQMRSLISVIESGVGKKETDNAFAILEKVITARGQK